MRMIKIAAVIVALVLAFAGGPLLRHYLVALFNDPKDLPALESDARVHFQSGAESCAQEVAALLPAAVARVETMQGRPFARSPIIGVYASFDDYARANGLEDAGIAAASRAGRVILSPTLCGRERDRLKGVLTHELSHSHLFGWRSSLFSGRPPSWFTEGLAVMVSDGGGAEGISDEAAIDAMRRGYAIVVMDKGLWLDFASIPFAIEPPREPAQDDFVTTRQRLAYREAGLFVAGLRRSDPNAFANLLQRIENGDAFGDSFRAAYVASPAERWREFLLGLSK